MKAFVVEKYGADRLVPAVVADPTIGPADVLVRSAPPASTRSTP